MSGPWHYKRAETLLNMLPSHGVNIETGLDRAETLAQAQVHATLALAAATAYPAVKDYLGDEASEPRDWTSVTERKREGQS